MDKLKTCEYCYVRVEGQEKKEGERKRKCLIYLDDELIGDVKLDDDYEKATKQLQMIVDYHLGRHYF